MLPLDWTFHSTNSPQSSTSTRYETETSDIILRESPWIIIQMVTEGFLGKKSSKFRKQNAASARVHD